MIIYAAKTGQRSKVAEKFRLILLPDGGGRLPDLGGRLPDGGGRLPDFGGRLPDGGGRLPDLGGRLPDGGGGGGPFCLPLGGGSPDPMKF